MPSQWVVSEKHSWREATWTSKSLDSEESEPAWTKAAAGRGWSLELEEVFESLS